MATNKIFTILAFPENYRLTHVYIQSDPFLITNLR